jgi:hypothetical protein
MASKLDTVDKAINNNEKVVEVPPRKSEKVRRRSQRESPRWPPHRERHGPRQDAHAFIQSGSRHQREKAPGPNATGSAMSPRAAEKPCPIPVIWDSPMLATRGSRMTTLHKRISLRTSTLTEVSSPTTRTGVTRTLRLPMATTRPTLSCPTSASPWHQLGSLQAIKFSFLTFLKSKKTRTLNELLKKNALSMSCLKWRLLTRTLNELPQKNPHPQ